MPKKEAQKSTSKLPDLKSAMKSFKASEEKLQKSAKPIAMPKITTKTSRSYNPDFTRSVLDQPKFDAGASIVRYSDADLNEFRELIQRKLEAAKKELNYLQGLITRKDEMGGDETDNRYMTMEDGSLSMEREQLSQMASRQITFIDHLEKAIMRIENKTYGVCRVTGKLIDKARLKAVPHATLSMEAKMGIVR
jgi:RNA polymerase-binding transcription factor DksA